MNVIVDSLPYIIMYFLSTLFCFLSQSKRFDKVLKIIMLLISILIPSFMAAFRYGIGTDYYNYLTWYNEIGRGVGYSRDVLDPGFLALSRLFFSIGIGYQGVLFSLSFLTSSSIMYALSKMKNKVSVTFGYMAYLLLYYQLSLNLMRQVLAASLFMVALVFIGNNKKINSFIYLTLGFLFHSSIIITAPMIIFKNIFIEKKYRVLKVLVYVLLLITILSLPIISPFIVNILNRIGRYVYYFAVGMEYQKIGFGIFRYFLIILVPGYIFRKEIKDIPTMKLFFSTSIIGYIIWLSSYISTNIIYRVSYNYLIVIVMCSAFFYEQSKSRSVKKRIIIKFIIILPIVFFWIYDFFILNTGETVPYISIFS